MAARSSLFVLHKKLHDQKDRALAEAFRSPAFHRFL